MSTEAGPGRDHLWSVTRRVAKNTIYLALADVAGKTMAFFYYLLAARHLGVERYGVLSFALAFTTMLGVLTDLGLGTIATREIARNPEQARSQVNNALTIRLVASVVIIAVIAVLVNLLGYPVATIRVVYICSVSVLTNAVASLLCNVFQGFERMELLAINRISQTAVLVIGAFLLLRGPSAAERYALLYVVAGVVSVVVGGMNAAPRLVRPKLSFDFGCWWKSLRASTPIGLAALFTMFYYWSGTTLLSKMAGNSAVGNYSAAFRLATALPFVGMAFSGAVYPLFSRLFAGGSDRLARALELSTKYMLWITLPAAAFGTVFARSAVLMLYGGGYQGASAVLRVLVWWGACASLNSLFSNYLISVRRSKAVTIQTGMSLAVNLGLAIVLIPVLGAMGAAASLAASEIAGLVYLTTSLLRSPGYVRVRPIAVNVLRVVLALGLAVLVAVVTSRWNVALGLVAGLAAYCVLLFVVRGAGKDDLQALRPLLGGTGE
jgi:O-antigen/teichoic acid export membrane protein